MRVEGCLILNKRYPYEDQHNFTTFLFVTVTSFSQEFKQDLKPFEKIVASPRINLILEQGDRESVRVVYNNIDVDKINVLVKGNTLHIYLDGAKKIEPTVRSYDEDYIPRHRKYRDASITAYVTYKKLDVLEIRGNQELTCHGNLESEKFVLRAYGENEIRLESLKTKYFIASLYGKNDLKVREGNVMEQKYRLYGENTIDTKALKSQYTFTNIFGEGKVRVNSTEEFTVNSFGEPKIYVEGGGQIFKRLVLGKAKISRR